MFPLGCGRLTDLVRGQRVSGPVGVSFSVSTVLLTRTLVVVIVAVVFVVKPREDAVVASLERVRESER